MTASVDDWHAGNDAYLAASLQWLRLLLERAATAPPAPAADEPAAPPQEAEADHGRPPRHRRRLTPSQEPGKRKALPVKTAVTQEEVDAAAGDRERAAVQCDPQPALIALASQLGLSPFERDILLLCAALALDPGTAARCARVQGDTALAHPTFSLALLVLPGATWDAFSPQRGLRYWQLVEISQLPGQPLTTSALRADERAVNYIKGLNELDDRLDTLLSPAHAGVAPDMRLPPSLGAVMGDVVRRWRQTAPGAQPPVIQLLGADPRSKLDVAIRAAATLDRALLRMPSELLPTQPTELDTLARLWHRESILLPVALYIDAEELDDPAGQQSLARFLARSDGAFVLGTREARTGIDRPTFAIDVQRPTPGEQRAVWDSALGKRGPKGMSGELAAQFDLAPSAISEIVRATAAEAPLAADAATRERLWDACLAGSQVRLDALAQRLAAKASWDDIVLPFGETALLRQIADQVAQRSRVYEDWGFATRMSRGLGISVLFSGPSGTGKTMAAEVLASELRLSLYRIDLSAVVSKYIGETEKNLRRLFDAAESGPALLFFDEADALFGKRSEVKDAHDRYANIEINYLLQRMEAYRGLAVLATNMQGALDQAFLRRLRFIVKFPFPAHAQRRAIWERIFPAETPVEGLDFERLARLHVTGGMVQNIALNAAFMAAQHDRPVTMDRILTAACTEFRKLELPLPVADLTLAEVGVP
jgi:hypothetical protein